MDFSTKKWIYAQCRQKPRPGEYVQKDWNSKYVNLKVLVFLLLRSKKGEIESTKHLQQKRD